MAEINTTVFIIDVYNKFSNDKIISVFKINGNWYCIKEVELNFGKPILSSIEESEDKYLNFHLYNTVEEARQYIQKIKQLEGLR